MRSTLILRASQARQPMIKFLGKRKAPQSIDHNPQPHPASPTHELPESFAQYRSRVQQHGPIGRGQNGQGSSSSSSGSSSSAVPRPPSAAQTSTAVSSMPAYGQVGGRSGRSLGSIKAKEGEFFDRSELPSRFRRMTWTDAEMDAITSGGATMVG